MSHMFANSTYLTDLNLDNWDTSKVKDMSYMFSSCESLSYINLNNENFDTRNVIFMNGMFQYCYSLTSLDISFFNTENVQNMSHLFDNCVSIKELATTLITIFIIGITIFGLDDLDKSLPCLFLFA